MTTNVEVTINVTVKSKKLFMEFAAERAKNQGCDSPTTLAQAAYFVFDLLDHERPKGCELYVIAEADDGSKHYT